MSEWFMKTMSSITSVGAKSKASQETKKLANDFRLMVANLKKGSSKHDCVFFFLEHLSRNPIDVLQECKIDKEVAIITKKYAKVVNKDVNDLTVLGESMAFFNVALKLITPDVKTARNIVNLLVTIMISDNTEILELSSDFLHSCLENTTLLNFMFTGESMRRIWRSCFIGHDNTSAFYASAFLATASTYDFRAADIIEPLVDSCRNTFRKKLITPNNIPNALQFIGYVVHNINTGNFIADLMPYVEEVATQLTSLQFFEYLLCTPSDSKVVVWKTLDRIMANPEITSAVMSTAVTAINNSKSPLPKPFSLTPFVRCMKDFPVGIQKITYDLLRRASKGAKHDFFCHSQPLSKTMIDTNVLKEIAASEEWENGLDPIISYFYLNSNPAALLRYFKTDNNMFEISSTLFNQLPRQSATALELLNRFIAYARDGYELIMPLINQIMQKIDVSSYMGSLIEFIEKGLPPFFYTGLISTMRALEEWSTCFIRSEGCRALGKILESEEGIDFLAVLANRGPIRDIDEYIQKNFDKCPLKDQSNETLTRLMLGMTRESTRPGFIRIPSLCAHIDPVPCNTPFDRYIFGTMGPSMMKMQTQHLTSVVGRVISPQNLSLVCDNPSLLTAATCTELPHTSLYQFHHSAKKAVAYAKLQTSFSFWIFIDDFGGKTVIATLDNENQLTLYKKGLRVFNSDKSYNLTLKRWHMVTLVRSELVNKKTAVYIDKEHVTTIPKTFDMITFGSVSDANSIWYLSSTMNSSVTEYTAENVVEIYDLGYHFASQYHIKLESGVKFVPYRGLVKYIHALGGPAFIFLRLMKCQSCDDFLLYLQCAFNLLALKQIQPTDFFSSIRYILMSRPEMYSKNVEAIMMFEFQTKDGVKWDYINNLFCDFGFLTLPNVSTSFLANVLIDNPRSKDSLQLLHYIIDTYVFFELDETAEAHFFTLLDAFIKIRPWILRKIALTIVGIPFCDSNDIKPFYDETRIEKQKKLLNVLIHDQALFFKNVPSELAFSIVPLLPTELGIKVLTCISEICCRKPEYFVLQEFRNVRLFMRMNSSSKELWFALFTFLTGKRSTKIEKFLSFDIKRPELYSFLLSLVCDLLPFDITNGTDGNRLSFTILHMLYSFAVSHKISFKSMVNQIQRLCTFGFDERDLQPQQNVISEESREIPKSSSVSRRRISFTESIRRRMTYSGEKQTTSTTQLGADLDQKLYGMAKRYISSCTFNDDLVEPPKIKTPEPPENFEDIINGKNEKDHEISDIVNLVIVIAVKTLIESTGDPLIFKSSLVALTIFGADVIPKVASVMHRKIILSFINQFSSSNGDVNAAFLEFITCRILEGWWDDEIDVLFSALLKLLGKRPRNANAFVLASFQRLHTLKEFNKIISVAIEFVKSRSFRQLLKDATFIPAFLTIIVTQEIVDNERSKPLWELFEQTMKNTEFVQSISKGKQLRYVEVRLNEMGTNIVKDLTDQAIANSMQIQHKRIGLSRQSLASKVSEFQKQCSSQAATIRRIMRYEFFYRLNRKSLDIDCAISRLFRANVREEQINNPSKYVMISSAPHPLCIPQKVVPCAFKYDVQCEKDLKLSKMMPRSHHVQNFKTTIPELQLEELAPQCLEGWKVPPFVPYGLAGLAEEHFGVESKDGVIGENLFCCQLLNTPEPLPCVCAMNDTSLNFILYATLTDDVSFNHQLVLHENSQLLCHYALIESAVKGFAGESSLFCNHPTLTIPYSSVTVAVPRRYEYKDKALDVYTSSGVSLTILFPPYRRKYFMSKLKPHKNILPVLGPSYSAQLLSMNIENVVRLWINQQISTLDYLLYLNTKSGRSFNDYSQYPVFPWVLADYASEDKPHEIRDLSKPMGMQTEPRAERFRVIYSETDPPYNYGTHYSSPAAVLYFMMRLEPFTLFNVQLHSGWDHKDRLFCDMEETWRSASCVNQADVKELIPQFFCVPLMFSNPNDLPLKERTDGHELSNVRLPPWSKSSFDFVWKMRASLESNKVRSQITDWIDLIFGFKQRGKEAAEASNVFHPLSYGFLENPPQQCEIDAVNNFGQCPQCIFQTSHPKSHTGEFRTLQNWEIHVLPLKKLRPDSDTIVVRDQELFCLPNLSHKVGNLDFSVRERCFKVKGEPTQYDDSLFDVFDTAVSSDNSLISIASESGFLLSYIINPFATPHFKQTTTCYYPGAAFKVVACSNHFGVVCASTPTELFLYDLSTGLLMKKVETTDRITHIVIDDVHGLIITTGHHVCSIFSVNLELLGEHRSQKGITAIAVGDSQHWIPNPFHITGHVDGTLYLWECNFYSNDSNQVIGFKGKPLGNVSTFPISGLTIFADNKAVVAADIEGSAIICSIIYPGQLLKASLFDNLPKIETTAQEDLNKQEQK